jgi:RNA polymerase-binding protein DksA
LKRLPRQVPCPDDRLTEDEIIVAKTATPTRTTEDLLPAETIARLKERLEQERARILTLYNQDLKQGKRSSNQGAEDLVDQANDAYNRELMLAISATERDQIFLIDQALERLEAGRYGYCLHSGEPIGLPRLEAVPWARFTIDVQEKIEKGLLDEESL